MKVEIFSVSPYSLITRVVAIKAVTSDVINKGRNEGRIYISGSTT